MDNCAMRFEMVDYDGIEIDELKAEIERLREALHQIESWSRAYPLEVFPKPNLKKARELLKVGGIGLDAIAADCMRHVVEGVGGIARAALDANRAVSDPDSEIASNIK